MKPDRLDDATLFDEAKPPKRDELDVLDDRAAALYQAYQAAPEEDKAEAWRIFELAEKAVEEAMPF